MVDLILFLVLLSLGFFFGRYAEKKHIESILKREKTFLALPTTNSRFILNQQNSVLKSHLVSGSVVISVDYFKRIAAGLRTLFGGSVQAYETLLDRARREAILRMKESCPHAHEIINLRIETSSISKGKGNQIGSVEVLAYATAIYFEP